MAPKKFSESRWNSSQVLSLPSWDDFQRNLPVRSPKLIFLLVTNDCRRLMAFRPLWKNTTCTGNSRLEIWEAFWGLDRNPVTSLISDPSTSVSDPSLVRIGPNTAAIKQLHFRLPLLPLSLCACDKPLGVAFSCFRLVGSAYPYNVLTNRVSLGQSVNHRLENQQMSDFYGEIFAWANCRPLYGWRWGDWWHVQKGTTPNATPPRK